MAKTKKKKWWATCWAPDYEIMVFRSGAEVLSFTATNGAQMISQIEVPPRTDKMLRAHFKSKDVCAIGVSYKKYSKEFATLSEVDCKTQ